MRKGPRHLKKKFKFENHIVDSLKILYFIQNIRLILCYLYFMFVICYSKSHKQFIYNLFVKIL